MSTWPQDQFARGQIHSWKFWAQFSKSCSLILWENNPNFLRVATLTKRREKAHSRQIGIVWLEVAFLWLECTLQGTNRMKRLTKTKSKLIFTAFSMFQGKMQKFFNAEKYRKRLKVKLVCKFFADATSKLANFCMWSRMSLCNLRIFKVSWFSFCLLFCPKTAKIKF